MTVSPQTIDRLSRTIMDVKRACRYHGSPKVHLSYIQFRNWKMQWTKMAYFGKIKAIFARRTDIKYAEVDIDDDEDKVTLKEATRGLRRPDGRLKSITTSYRRLSQHLGNRSTLLLWLNIILFTVSSFLFWSSIQDNRDSLREQTAMPCKSCHITAHGSIRLT